ncbi:MAG: hypothetical protein VR70_05785 [Rhodospirillaceae bacterium BRH_c57]|nr:MAG: hypothetical protein VR70_05785 [Rhodospirillaceae bacterium BRH_c57]
MPTPVHVVWVAAGTPWSDALLPGEGVRAIRIVQSEGHEGAAYVTLERPSAGLLAPGQPSYAWIVAVPDDDGPPVPRFYGRVIAGPASSGGYFADLELDCRPVDTRAAITEALAPLKVAPGYDPLYHDVENDADPVEVLDGWPRALYVDQTTGAITTTHIISGDGDPPVLLDQALIDGDSVEYVATGAPIPHVDVTVEAQWTQRGNGTIDLGEYLRRTHGPTIKTASPPSHFATRWWREGEDLEGGYVVQSTNLIPQYPGYIPKSSEIGSLATKVVKPYSLIPWYSLWRPLSAGSSGSRSVSGPSAVMLLQAYRPEMSVSWSFSGRRVERVVCRVEGLAQDVGQISPEAEELSVRLPDIAGGTDDAPAVQGAASVVFGPGIVTPSDDPIPPIGDPMRGSFFLTDRGKQAAAHAFQIAATRIIASQRCIEVSFRLPGLPRAGLALTTAKAVTITSPRLPGGQATGKVIDLEIVKGNGAEEIRVVLGVSVGIAPTLPEPPTEDNGYVATGYVTPGYIWAPGAPLWFGLEAPVILADWSDQIPPGLLGLTGITADSFVVSSSVTMQTDEQLAYLRPDYTTNFLPIWRGDDPVLTKVELTLQPLAPDTIEHTITASLLSPVGIQGGIDLAAEAT